MSSSETRRREVTELMWYAAEDCSRSVQRRLEKLGRRRLRVGYGEQTVHETKRNADAFETPTLLDDEDICKAERPAWNLSAVELSASAIGVGAAWCDRSLWSRPPVFSSRTHLQSDRIWWREAVRLDTLLCWKVSWCAVKCYINTCHWGQVNPLLMWCGWWSVNKSLLSRRSRQLERLSASVLSICSSVCLSPKCKKNAIFSKTKQFIAVVCIDDL